MKSREEVLPKLTVGTKLKPMFSKFDLASDSILTLQEIDVVNFNLIAKNEIGAKIIMPLGASYRYELDDNYFQIFHNDRSLGWQIVEKYKIIPEA